MYESILLLNNQILLFTDVLKTDVPEVLATSPASKIIPSSAVILHNRIGSGRFGDVFLGTWLDRIIVAVREVLSPVLNSFMADSMVSSALERED